MFTVIKKASNKICDLTSIDVSGHAQQFLTETGGEFTISNSSSNYGQNALVSKGYRDDTFLRDDVGLLTNIIPPKENVETDINLEYGAVDVSRTVSSATTSRLYLYQETNLSAPPESVVQGYRIGAKVNDRLNTLITQEGTPIEYYARIIMPSTENTTNEVSSVKVSNVGRSSGINSITDSTLTFTGNRKLLNSESIRILSDNARLPDGIDANRIYYAITNNLNADQIKIATSLLMLLMEKHLQLTT